MATAAEAAQAATEGAGGAETGAADEGAQDGGTPQGGAAGASGADQGADGGSAPAQGAQAGAAKPPVSETVRLARELRRAQARVQELEKRGAPAPVQQHAATTREQLLADLRKEYEADPEALIQSIAGEDFYGVAKRVQARNEAPETKIQQLERELAELKGATTDLTKQRETDAQRAADAETQRHMSEVAKEIEATDTEGNLKYPTLATLDPEALEEPIALTAYNAVARAWDKECRKVDEKTGKRVQFKEWSAAEVEDRFGRAFKALEAHYSKLRTPRSRSQGTQPAQDAEFAPTISTSTSSGPVERPTKAAPGTLPWDVALRMALKEQGLS